MRAAENLGCFKPGVLQDPKDRPQGEQATEEVKGPYPQSPATGRSWVPARAGLHGHARGSPASSAVIHSTRTGSRCGSCSGVNRHRGRFYP